MESDNMEFELPRNISHAKTYTDDELIEFIKKYFNEKGTVPTIKDFTNNFRYPSFATYQRRFGSWNNALIKAGYDANSRDYTNDELLDSLKRFFEENGRVPTSKDFLNNSKYPSFSAVVNRFGSWNGALIKAKLEISRQYYTDNELLNILRRYYTETGEIPTYNEFLSNKKYPSSVCFAEHFGTWNNALKLAGMDIDMLIREGKLDNKYHKGRLGELTILDSFKTDGAIDLSGNNALSIFDGICPKGKTYDVKSSKLIGTGGYLFHFMNKKKQKIEYFFLCAFNEDFSKLLHVWLIPNILVNNKGHIWINNSSRGEFNIYNMEMYEVTKNCTFKEE